MTNLLGQNGTCRVSSKNNFRQETDHSDSLKVNHITAGCLHHPAVIRASLPPSTFGNGMHQTNNRNFTMTNNNFQGLLAQIKGREFDLAQTVLGLADGKGNGHTQACPVCGGGKNGDRFYFRADTCTFHCKKCPFALDIFDLIAKIKDITRDEAFDIIAAEAGYGKPDDTIESAVSESVAEQQGTVPPVEKYANAAVPIVKGQRDAIANRRVFQALKDFIAGREGEGRVALCLCKIVFHFFQRFK